MKRLLFVAFAAGCGQVSAMPDGAPPDAAADAVPRATQIRATIDAVAAPAMAQSGSVGLAVGVIDGNDRVLAFYGVSSVGGSAPDEHTLFELGSLSKTFTATLLADAAQADAVSLDDPLSTYLPAPYQFPSGSPQAGITLVELADHTSGLPRNPTDVASGASSYTDDQMDADVDGLTLASAPGAAFAYLNLGYALLGEALADHAGTSWRALVHDDLTAPLGMTDTAVYADLSSDQVARAAIGYASATPSCSAPPCPVSPSLILASFPAPAVNPAGGLYASPDDLMTWLAFNLGRSTDAQLTSLLDALRKKRVQTGPGDWCGLAWNTSAWVDAQGSHDELWKDGDTNGFHAFITYVPDEQRGVIVMANFPIAPGQKMIGEQILAALP